MKGVMVIDNAAEVRRRLCELLSELPDVRAEGCHADWREVEARLEEVDPCCVVIDVPVAGPAGFDLLARLRRTAPACVIVVLTNRSDGELERRSREIGADHFLAKAADFERLVDLVRDLGCE